MFAAEGAKLGQFIVGDLDESLPREERLALLDEAIARAATFGRYPSSAFAMTKLGARKVLAEEIRAGVAANLQALTG